MFSRGDTTHRNQHGALVARERSTAIRYLVQEATKRGMFEGQLGEIKRWTQLELEEVDRLRRDWLESNRFGVSPHFDEVKIGDTLPRRVIGPHTIATFTTDLCTDAAAEYGDARLFAIPVNEPDCSYDYPERVRLELSQEDLTSYERAAEFLNFNGNDLVCMQHEYGIFGGIAGSHILTLLRKLKMPLVTTLHTILREPDSDQRAVLEEIAHLSDRLIVMSEHAACLLRDVYGVPGGKIDLIPHGVPDLPFTDPN